MLCEIILLQESIEINLECSNCERISKLRIGKIAKCSDKSFGMCLNYLMHAGADSLFVEWISTKLASFPTEKILHIYHKKK